MLGCSLEGVWLLNIARYCPRCHPEGEVVVLSRHVLNSCCRSPVDIHVTMENFEAQTRWFQNNIKELYNKQCNDIRGEVPKEYVPEV